MNAVNSLRQWSSAICRGRTLLRRCYAATTKSILLERFPNAMGSLNSNLLRRWSPVFLQWWNLLQRYYAAPTKWTFFSSDSQHNGRRINAGRFFFELAVPFCYDCMQQNGEVAFTPKVSVEECFDSQLMCSMYTNSLNSNEVLWDSCIYAVVLVRIVLPCCHRMLHCRNPERICQKSVGVIL